MQWSVGAPEGEPGEVSDSITKMHGPTLVISVTRGPPPRGVHFPDKSLKKYVTLESMPSGFGHNFAHECLVWWWASRKGWPWERHIQLTDESVGLMGHLCRQAAHATRLLSACLELAVYNNWGASVAWALFNIMLVFLMFYAWQEWPGSNVGVGPFGRTLVTASLPQELLNQHKTVGMAGPVLNAFSYCIIFISQKP